MSKSRAELIAENEQLRKERDVLLQEPIDLAKLDSIDEDASGQMVAYYWWKQAQGARSLIRTRKYSVEEIDLMRAYVGWLAHRSDNAEDQLRTYMLNGTDPSELKEKYEVAVTRRIVSDAQAAEMAAQSHA